MKNHEEAQGAQKDPSTDAADEQCASQDVHHDPSEENAQKEREAGAEDEGAKTGGESEEAAYYKERLLRMQAEFENYKKRTAREQEAYTTMANASLMKELLGSLDAFEQARRHEENTHLQTLHEQLLGVLKRAGLQEIGSEGEAFDPHLHEVLTSTPSNEDEGRILEVYQKGYLLGDAVLRHAKVRVSKHDDTLRDDTTGN